MDATTATAQDPMPGRPGPSVLWLPLSLLLLLVIYPLSVGPMWKLAEANIVPWQTLLIYRPLFSIRQTRQFFGWYIEKVWKVRIIVQT